MQAEELISSAPPLVREKRPHTRKTLAADPRLRRRVHLEAIADPILYTRIRGPALIHKFKNLQGNLLGIPLSVALGNLLGIPLSVPKAEADGGSWGGDVHRVPTLLQPEHGSEVENSHAFPHLLEGL